MPRSRTASTSTRRPAAFPELKEAIAEKLSRENGVDYSPTEVVACVGGKQAVCNVFLAICNPGDEVVVHAPTWPTFLEQIKLAQGTHVTVPLASPFAITADPLLERISSKTRAILINSPCNPTGQVADPAEIRKLAAACVERGIYLIADETYEHFLYGDAEHLSPASMGPDEKAHVITVNTVSKTYAMTGWRLGYVAGPEPVIKAINDLMSQITSNPTSASQKAAIAALTGPQDCVREMVAEFRERRTLLVEGLRKAGYTCALPGGAFYAFPQVKGDEQDMAVADRLLEEAHVATVPGSSFLADGYLRMSYATSREKLQEGLERLRKASYNPGVTGTALPRPAMPASRVNRRAIANRPYWSFGQPQGSPLPDVQASATVRPYWMSGRPLRPAYGQPLWSPE